VKWAQNQSLGEKRAATSKRFEKHCVKGPERKMKHWHGYLKVLHLIALLPLWAGQYFC